MKIYTKILLGMVAGALIGLGLGPNSGLLEKDAFVVPSASAYAIETEVDGVASSFRLPNAPARFEILETKSAELTDSKGNLVMVPATARVSFKLTRAMALKDKAGVLTERFGKYKVGQGVQATLIMANTPKPDGGFMTAPKAVSGFGSDLIRWLSPIGEAFMRLIKMVIVPLVFSSLLVGVASLGDVRKLGRLGGKTLGLYLATTAAAVTIGLVVAHVISPGSFIDVESKMALQSQYTAAAGAKVDAAAEAPSAIDNVLNIIPINPVESMSSGNMLQIIFFAVLFGIALTLLDQKNGRPVVNFFDRVQHAMVLIIHMVMATAPYGVAALVAEVIGSSGFSVLQALLVYSLAVVVGLFLHAALVYGSIVKFITRMPLKTFLKGARPAQLIAFSTSSSSAALPVTMECAEENLGVSNPVASFVIPLGSTVNMDGTALYQGVAAIFIAQVFQMDLSVADQLGIVLTATMASIGAAGVPGAGMVTLAMVLTTAGIPTVGVALILGMDRLLDMFRTAVNVTGDLAVTTAMAAGEGELSRQDVLSPTADAADPNRGFEGRLSNLEEKEHPVKPT